MRGLSMPVFEVRRQQQYRLEQSWPIRTVIRCLAFHYRPGTRHFPAVKLPCRMKSGCFSLMLNRNSVGIPACLLHASAHSESPTPKRGGSSHESGVNHVLSEPGLSQRQSSAGSTRTALSERLCVTNCNHPGFDPLYVRTAVKALEPMFPDRPFAAPCSSGRRAEKQPLIILK